MFGYYYGFDYYYLILVIPAVLISLIAQIKVKSAFSKYSKVSSRLTGAEAAERLLNSKGVTGVKIERVSGNLTDHFDPRTNVIRLSDSVYSANTVAAVGVACHEAGHAVQYAENYLPIKIRNKIVPLTQFGSYLSWPLLLFGLIFNYSLLIDIGILLFGLVVLFQLITLPVEFNASHRAISALEDTGAFYGEEEHKGVKKVLSAAAMTYVAALIVSLAQMLRLILLTQGRRRR
ncbi:MAG: zinc metallopeptidase [Clostridia bacterium]|jgi:Zn-dependent membrane protease YugP|nr:zinc metallopeptidase [Clostridia bacterium]